MSFRFMRERRLREQYTPMLDCWGPVNGLRAIERTGADGLCAGGEALAKRDIAHLSPRLVRSRCLDDLFAPVDRDENPGPIARVTEAFGRS
jgi:hypothetical protein